MFGRSVLKKEIGQCVEHILAVEAPLNGNCQAFSAELIDDGEHADFLSVLSTIFHKVVSPDVVAVHGPQPDTRTIVESQAAPFLLSCRQFQPLAPPDPFDPLVVHSPARILEQGRDPPVAVTPIGPRQLYDVGRQGGFIIWCSGDLALGRTMLPQDPACPPLRYAQSLADMPDCLTATRGA